MRITSIAVVACLLSACVGLEAPDTSDTEAQVSTAPDADPSNDCVLLEITHVALGLNREFRMREEVNTPIRVNSGVNVVEAWAGHVVGGICLIDPAAFKNTAHWHAEATIVNLTRGSTTLALAFRSVSVIDGVDTTYTDTGGAAPAVAALVQSAPATADGAGYTTGTSGALTVTFNQPVTILQAVLATSPESPGSGSSNATGSGTTWTIPIPGGLTCGAAFGLTVAINDPLVPTSTIVLTATTASGVLGCD